MICASHCFKKFTVSVPAVHICWTQAMLSLCQFPTDLIIIEPAYGLTPDNILDSDLVNTVSANVQDFNNEQASDLVITVPADGLAPLGISRHSAGFKVREDSWKAVSGFSPDMGLFFCLPQSAVPSNKQVVMNGKHAIGFVNRLFHSPLAQP